MTLAQRCKWCRSPSDLRESWDRSWLDGTMKPEEIAVAGGFARASAYRHVADHVRPAMAAAARRADDHHLANFAERLLSLADEASDVREATRDPRVRLSAVKVEVDVLTGALGKLGIDSGEQVLALGEARDLVRAVVDVVALDPDVGNKIAAALEQYHQGELGRRFMQLAERTRNSRPKELVR